MQNKTAVIIVASILLIAELLFAQTFYPLLAPGEKSWSTGC